MKKLTVLLILAGCTGLGSHAAANEGIGYSQSIAASFFHWMPKSIPMPKDEGEELKVNSKKHESVRFLESSDAKLYDSDDNVLKCGKCGKIATGATMGMHAFKAYCMDHAPWVKEEEK